MNKTNTAASIEQLVKKQFRKDAKLNNAYLLVHWEAKDLHFAIAEGTTGETPADPRQPNYMASVGKLFTSVIIGMLQDQGKLSFRDSISLYLDQEIMNGLHVYEGTDCSRKIQIRHLLNHTSGLPDNFKPLLERVLEDPEFRISPRQAVEWTKQHSSPLFSPGSGFTYTDTNYHLLGLIIESITGRPFHEVLHDWCFRPLGMEQSWMLHASEPDTGAPVPPADFFLNNRKLNVLPGYGQLDYAGGGVVAPLEDLLKFMQALQEGRLVESKTLEIMHHDGAKFGPGIYYGYGIWQFVTIPVVMPKKFNCWGVIGITGAFMVHHPGLDAYIIGNFNDFSYERSCVRFLFKVISKLHKLK